MNSIAATYESARPCGADCASQDTVLRAVPWQDMEASRAQWDALASRASEPNPFFESWYLLPALQHLPDTDAVSILRFERGGRLAGIVPISRATRYYRYPLPHLSSWIHANCFLGVPLVERGGEQAFWTALLDWADTHANAALFLHLRCMPLDGPMYDALKTVAARRARTWGVVFREDRALLASQLSPAAYLEASLSGKKRKELRRQHTRLAEQGALRVERVDDSAGIEAWCTSFLALEAAGWKGKAGSALAADPGTQALFRESLTQAARNGRLERLSLWLDDEPVAMLASFLVPPGAFSYKTAFDERYSRFSPGVLLQRENLEMLARPEISWCDSCAAADHPMIDHLWRERRAVGRVSIAIGGRLRRALFNRLLRMEIARAASLRKDL